MCVPAVVGAALIAAAASAGGALYSADQQRKSAHDAADKQAAAAAATGTAQKSTNADTTGVSTVNGPAAAGVNSGQASTLLTGPGGVDPSKLNLGGASALGANTLLGS